MFYGKANVAKHYRKVADEIERINPRYRASVEARSIQAKDGRQTQALEIRIWVSPAEIAFRFWVNPHDDCWVFRQARIDLEGEWSDLWKDTVEWVGEPNWDPPHFGAQKKPFTFRNSAKTTAQFFFLQGPLTNAS